MTLIPYEIAEAMKLFEFHRPLDVKWAAVPPPPSDDRPFQVQCYCTFKKLFKVDMLIYDIGIKEWESADWYFGQCPSCHTIFWTYRQKKDLT
jgi:hypothetical protein